MSKNTQREDSKNEGMKVDDGEKDSAMSPTCSLAISVLNKRLNSKGAKEFKESYSAPYRYDNQQNEEPATQS